MSKQTTAAEIVAPVAEIAAPVKEVKKQRKQAAKPDAAAKPAKTKKRGKAITPAQGEPVATVTTSKVIIDQTGKLTGAQVVRMQSDFQIAKVRANNLHKEEVHTLSFLLKQVKKHAIDYAKELSLRSGKKVSVDTINALAPAQFVAHLTDGEKARLEKNGNKWSFWLLLSVCARYYGKKPSEATLPKIAPKVATKTAGKR